MLCLLDLSKCFDVIDHTLLMQKLMLHGIEISWFAAYLNGHTQSVSLKDGSGRRVLSRPLSNTMGVFQGSALGPLLFTIFSNNLSLYAGDADVFQYADDTQVLVSGPARHLEALISRMEDSLASLNDWFCANALKVNASKTQLIVFGSRQNLRKLPDFRVSFRDAALQPCAQVGNLGVTFDSTLSWDVHVSELCRRCTGLLIGLSHARQKIIQFKKFLTSPLELFSAAVNLTMSPTCEQNSGGCPRAVCPISTPLSSHTRSYSAVNLSN